MKSLFQTLLVILLFGETVNAQELKFAVEDSLRLSTVFIENQNYIITDYWDNIPVNQENGEDINSKKYGGRYYPMYRDVANRIIERRISVAKESLKIWLDLVNYTETTFQLYSVEVFVINEFKLPHQFEVGKWRSTPLRLNNYSPKILISPANEGSNIVKVNESVIISPSRQNKTDNRFSVQIENASAKAYNDTIIQFLVKFKLVNTKVPEQTIELASDKLFFLAFSNKD